MMNVDTIIQPNDTDTVRDLKKQIFYLRSQLALQEARNTSVKGNCLLRSGHEDYYPGEQLDFILSIFEQVKDRCNPDSRPYEILNSLLESNRPVGRGKEILTEVNRIFRNGSALTPEDVSKLNSLGFTYTQSRKHPKLRFHGKYMFVISTTPSDSRHGGKNALKEIEKCIAVGLKV